MLSIARIACRAPDTPSEIQRRCASGSCSRMAAPDGTERMKITTTGTKEKRWCITALLVRPSRDVMLRSPSSRRGLVTTLRTTEPSTAEDGQPLEAVTATMTTGQGPKRPGQDRTFSNTSMATSTHRAQRPKVRQRPRATVPITAWSRKK